MYNRLYVARHKGSIDTTSSLLGNFPKKNVNKKKKQCNTTNDTTRTAHNQNKSEQNTQNTVNRDKPISNQMSQKENQVNFCFDLTLFVLYQVTVIQKATLLSRIDIIQYCIQKRKKRRERIPEGTAKRLDVHHWWPGNVRYATCNLTFTLSETGSLNNKGCREHHVHFHRQGHTSQHLRSS